MAGTIAHEINNPLTIFKLKIFQIIAKIDKYNLRHSILDLYNKNIPIAVTSAGTAIQSELMLTGNGTETIKGLGTLKNFIVDQHYLVRNREYRLLGALDNHNTYHGLGVDEDMSIAIEDEKYFKALGPSSIILYLRKGRDIRELQLFDGDSHQLNP